jgi:hypothetical protein
VTLARVTLWILLAFGVEIVLKILIYSPYLFVKDPFNIFDSAVVFLSLVLTVAELAMAGKSMAVLRAARTLYRVVKALRTIRSLRFLAKSLTSSKAAARHVTGRNKQRYVDLANQIDLDLCYVNDDQNLIVMSVPATGRLALFRNPLPEVSALPRCQVLKRTLSHLTHQSSSLRSGPPLLPAQAPGPPPHLQLLPGAPLRRAGHRLRDRQVRAPLGRNFVLPPPLTPPPLPPGTPCRTTPRQPCRTSSPS